MKMKKILGGLLAATFIFGTGAGNISAAAADKNLNPPQIDSQNLDKDRKNPPPQNNLDKKNPPPQNNLGKKNPPPQNNLDKKNPPPQNNLDKKNPPPQVNPENSKKHKK